MDLPSFSLKFPKFKLNSKWKKLLYGNVELFELPSGQLSIHAHPSLNGINVELSHDHNVNFSTPDWKLSVLPLSFNISAPKLFHGDGLHLLRGDDGEIGVSFDKNASRHFFFVGKPLSLPKFSLKFAVSFCSNLLYVICLLTIFRWMAKLSSTRNTAF